MSLRMAGMAALLLATAFLGLQRGLWTPDEPREAEIGREMLLAPGVIPTLDAQPFIEKPPLYYWVVAGVYATAGVSAAAARSVSAMASLLTLLLVFVWTRRAHSALAGVLAAVLLSSSVQFLVSSHWVLLDPLLMLFTTAALWAAWELLSGARPAWRALLYGALILALWTKGLIGPVLVGAGVLAYLLGWRGAGWRKLAPVLGALALAAALGLWVLLLWRAGGRALLWQWAWVNHVQRLLNPGVTGHRQPLPYYLWTLPYALLPWLVLLLEAVRPEGWRSLTRGAPLRRYCVSGALGMLVVLSISATKRETYLLPLLPLLFVWLGMHAAEWWQRWRLTSGGVGALWWWQLGLLSLCLVLPAALGLAWLRRADQVCLAVLVLAAALCVSALAASWRGERERAGLLLLSGALALPFCAIPLAQYLLNSTKDMAPFVALIGERLPPGAPVYATGVDETLQAIVPFVTGRQLLAVDPQRDAPDWLLVQDNRARGFELGARPSYVLEAFHAFGPGRRLELWHRLSGLAGG